MYKDKEKQKQANKERQRRYRNKQKGVTSEGVTDKALQGGMDDIPSQFLPGSQEIMKQSLETFADLPGDVQRSIERLSGTPEEKSQRTAIALSYQKMFGKSPSNGLGCCIPKNSAKPGDPDYQEHTGPDEHCQCGAVLPRLEQPRQYPSTCLPCVTGKVAV